MAIIGFSRGQEVEFIPAYSGNRDSAEPCTIGIKYVPYEAVLSYSRQITSQTRNLKDQSKAIEVSQAVQKKQFIENVTSVTGFNVGERAITTAAELWEVAPTDLISEIIGAMEDSAKLSEGQRKN